MSNGQDIVFGESCCDKGFRIFISRYEYLFEKIEPGIAKKK